MTELEVLMSIRQMVEVGVFCLELSTAFLAGLMIHRFVRGQ